MSPNEPDEAKMQCLSCRDNGHIYQDIGLTGQRRHPCTECEGAGSVRPPFPDRPLLTPAPDVQLFVESTGRYCELCQDAAQYDDMDRRTGKTVHRSRVCLLWQLGILAENLKSGDIVSSYKLLNYYAPMQVVDLMPLPYDNKIMISLRRCRWAAAGEYVVLACDGPTVSRDFYRADPMPRAVADIAERRFLPGQIPPNWLTMPTAAVL